MQLYLKQSITGLIQDIEHNFLSLSLDIHSISDLQWRSLGTLGLSIKALSSNVEEMIITQETLASITRHDLYNQITVISGFAQILKHKRAGNLEATTIIYLDKIVEICGHIEVALKADKQFSVVRA